MLLVLSSIAITFYVVAVVSQKISIRGSKRNHPTSRLN